MLQSVSPEGRTSVDVVLSGPFSVMMTLSGVISETLKSASSTIGATHRAFVWTVISERANFFSAYSEIFSEYVFRMWSRD